MATSVEDLLSGSALRRAARLAAVREFRPTRLPARTAVALGALTTGTLTAATVITWPHSFLRGFVTRAEHLLRTLPLHDPAVLGVAGSVTGLGLVLMLLAVLPGRTRTEPLRSTDPLVIAGVGRRGLGWALAVTAADVPGVESASVRLRRRLRCRAIVRAVTTHPMPAGLAEEIRNAVAVRLAEIEPVHHRTVIVRLTWRRP
ncbi:MAG TPA: DUF6286 domain-containing protein [Streptosporangiaceae bacterium]|jgi:hypothetical protein|nr:DUF6286 domain-containing protein [Streptosporangiaceae bacterium]